MKYVVLIYNDPALLDAMPTPEFNATMRECLGHADEMKDQGKLLQSQMLESPGEARSIRIRNGRTSITDGPFAETKEILGGFNIIEAEDMEEAVQLAQQFPWAASGCVEIRPVRDMETVREQVAVR